MINLNLLSISDYNKLIAHILGLAENNISTPYFDTKDGNKHVTIGRGFDIEGSIDVREYVFHAMNIGGG